MLCVDGKLPVSLDITRIPQILLIRLRLGQSRVEYVGLEIRAESGSVRFGSVLGTISNRIDLFGL